MSQRRNASQTRVLLVDDEPELTSTLRVGLRRQMGWSVDTADSAEQALELLEKKVYDAIVSDERMPGMQGSDLLTIARRRWPETIRITLSGQASLERAIVAINSADVDRFLIKPCGRPEIAATIEELLEARAENRALQAERDRLTDAPRPEVTAQFEDAMDRLWMAFQPIFNGDGTIFAHEALVRSDSPVYGTPLALLGVAEELGRSEELARRIREVTAAAIPRAPEGTKIFVNVDPDQLEDNELYDPGAPLSAFAERIVVEVTERSSLGGDDNLSERLRQLLSMGYKVAVDDLGAGYAGLNTFTLVSPDIVKFDAAMIRNLDQSPTKAAVVAAMTGLCRSLGIGTIAEGIETAEELAKARELGCDYAQGYHLARPAREFFHERISAAA